MLTSITIQADPALDIPIIGATIKDEYLIKGVTGLGPPDINVSIGELHTDGGVYQGRRVPSRNPVILLGLNPKYKNNQTIDDLRDVLYRIFLEPMDDNSGVEVTLHDSAKQDRYIRGHVDKFEVSQFVKNPEVQVSLLCTDPFLKGAEVSVVPTTFTVTVDNLGSATCGFYMDLTFTANTSGFTINRGVKDIFNLDYEFLNGDELEISTILGERSIRRKRAGVWLNIIDTTVELTNWPYLRPGADTLGISTANITWSAFSYTPRWWGV